MRFATSLFCKSIYPLFDLNTNCCNDSIYFSYLYLSSSLLYNILLRHLLSYFPTLVQLEMSMKSEENTSRLYEISGPEKLGSILRIQSCSDEATDLAKCSIQWYRLSSQCSRREPILGINFMNFLFSLA